MDESAILHGETGNCMTESQVYLNCCKCNFSRNCSLIHLIIYDLRTFTKPSGHYRTISSEPVQFQGNLCNFK